MRNVNAKLITITEIKAEGAHVVALCVPKTDASDHRVFDAKVARLLPLFPEPLSIREPYKPLQLRQVVMCASGPVAIDTRRLLRLSHKSFATSEPYSAFEFRQVEMPASGASAIDARRPLLEAS